MLSRWMRTSSKGGRALGLLVAALVAVVAIGTSGCGREASEVGGRKVAFIPRAMRNAVPIGGASLLIPKGNTPAREAAAWKLIKYLTSAEINGGWSRFTGYFARPQARADGERAAVAGTQPDSLPPPPGALPGANVDREHLTT